MLSRRTPPFATPFNAEMPKNEGEKAALAKAYAAYTFIAGYFIQVQVGTED